MSHTPGPWEIPVVLMKSQGKYSIETSGAYLICEVSNCNNYEANYANAKLIAAAPELLEELESLVNFLEVGDAEEIFLASARAAIKKARGL